MTAQRGWAAALVAVGVTAVGVAAGTFGRMRARARAALLKPLSKQDAAAISRMEGEGGPSSDVSPQAAGAEEVEPG